MAHEGKAYGNAARAYRQLVIRPENPVYGELERYAGELLTIESITVGILKSKVSAHVRYDETTEFDIDIYKSEYPLFLHAGFSLPAEIGTHEFHAEITCRFDRVPYERGMWALFVETVEPIRKTEQLPETTPLQAQSAIYWLLKHDTYLQKLVGSVTLHHDMKGNPIVRIQLYSRNKSIIESVVAPMATGVAVLYSVIEYQPFYGMIAA